MDSTEIAKQIYCVYIFLLAASTRSHQEADFLCVYLFPVKD